MIATELKTLRELITIHCLFTKKKTYMYTSSNVIVFCSTSVAPSEMKAAVAKVKTAFDKENTILDT